MELNDAEFYFNRSSVHYEAGDYRLAIADCTQVITLEPNNADAYNNRGLVYQELKEYQLAIDDYTQAIVLAPNDVTAYFSRSSAHYEAGAYQLTIADCTQIITLESNNAVAYDNRGLAHRHLEEYQLAIDDYTQAIGLDPDYVIPYYNRGLAYQDLGEYQLAIDDYTQVIKIDPEFANAHNDRGSAHRGLKEYQLAIADYTQAIVLDPNDADAYFSRGSAYQHLKEYQLAITDYTQAIALDPNDAIGYFNRGSAHQSLKQYRLAIDGFTQSIALDPNDAAPYYNRGLAYQDLEEYQLAIDDYTQAIKIAPDDGVAYFSRGSAHQDMKEYQLAIDDYTQAIALDPDYAKAYYGRGFARQGLKEHRSAIDDYAQVIVLDPNNTGAYNNRGLAYQALKEYQRAIDDYTQAIEIDPEFANAHNNRGLAYQHLKEYQLAIADYNQTIVLAPNDVKAYFNRGIAYQHLKEYQRAIDDYTQAIEIAPDNAAPYNNRGSAHQSLKQYQLAIDDYNQSIALDSNEAVAYYNRANTYVTLIDYAQAQADYVRYSFFGELEYFQYYKLLAFFRDYADAPFVVKRLLRLNPILDHLHSYQGFLERVEEQSQRIFNFLDSSEMRGGAEQEPERFLYLSALCQYFMGDTAEAFRIFDDQIDPVYRLSLMGHYYYVQSALFSALPENSVTPLREDALKAANALCDAAAPTDLTQLYYAGLILHHFGDDTERAAHCFNRAKGLLPAKYMLWLIAPPQQQVAIGQDILAHEAKLPPEKSFGKGLAPRPVSLAFSEYGGAMQHYCFYHEIAEAIEGIHAGEVPTQTAAFYDYWQFAVDETEREALTEFRKAREAERVYQAIGETLDDLKQQIDHSQLEKNIKESTTTIMREFENLQRDAATLSGDELAFRLASTVYDTAILDTYGKLNIHGFQFLEVHQKLALYFYLTGKISVRTTVNLIFYAIYTARRFNPKLMLSIAKEGLADGIIDIVKSSESLKEVGMLVVRGAGVAFATAWGAPVCVFVISFMAKGLWLLMNESVLKPDARLSAGDDYRLFLSQMEAKLVALKDEQPDIPEFNKMMEY